MLIVAILSFADLVGTSPFNTQLMEPGSYRLQMYHQGNPVGTALYEIIEDGGQLLLRETTVIEAADVDTGIETRIDSQSAAPVDIRINGMFFGYTADVDITWSDGMATGYSIMPRPENQPQGRMEISMASGRGVFERTSVFFLIGTLELAEGTGATFTWLNTYDGTLHEITARVEAGGSVEVPAGSFDTWKVHLDGAQPPVDIYVSKENRKIVQMVVAGSPWSYGLLP